MLGPAWTRSHSPTVKQPAPGLSASGTPVPPDGMHMHATEVHLEVPEGIEPELERQIREYVKLQELGEQLGDEGMIDPTSLT